MQVPSVIKFEGSNDILVWKHPEKYFNTSLKGIDEGLKTYISGSSATSTRGDKKSNLRYDEIEVI